MKLNTLTDQDLPEIVVEAKRSSNKEHVPMPLGIDLEDFTEEYKDRLRKIKKTDPELYNALMTG